MTAPIDTGQLRSYIDVATDALDRWATRDNCQPGVRSAANSAVEAIDAAARELYRIRGELVGQVRAYDDATAARADALLARIRAERNLYERDEPVTGGPLPADVEGYRPGGAR